MKGDANRQGIPRRISISRPVRLPHGIGGVGQPQVHQIQGVRPAAPQAARLHLPARMCPSGRRTGRQLYRQPPYLARAELVQRTWHHPRQTSGIRRIPTAQAVDEDECQATDDTAAASGNEYLAGEKRNGQGRQASFGCRAT